MGYSHRRQGIDRGAHIKPYFNIWVKIFSFRGMGSITNDIWTGLQNRFFMNIFLFLYVIPSLVRKGLAADMVSYITPIL